ncbi:AfsR/SARP family transcriptional regulator [Streptomyces paludis]|uniref:AfsR family transcriptional regulator n=1 Tax=Streptomyces paludis TaxID=2282738 RepID=A0A345HLW7_9ACTN|nr:BTAD domain-containing putative transcriptional regulator [Streptomyces paludis]AXG77691.1 AfsR family transcriptional regulator [Streptomyces paludis]
MSEPSQQGFAVNLLGPLRLRMGHRELTVGPPKQQAVLALLAGHRGAVVSRAQIVDALWGTEAPSSSANAVHTYVAGLRRTLEPDRGSRDSGAFLVSRPGGYELRLPAEAVDSAVFVDRYQGARKLAAAGEATALDRFESALALWRGEALAGIPGPYAALERTRLRELRYAATEGWLAGLIDAGRYEAAIVASADAIAQEPLREPLRRLSMVALYRSGRAAHAIRAYDETRALLREELGIDPGPELRELHRRMLAGDLADDLAPGPRPPRQSPGPTPGPTPASPAPVRRSTPVRWSPPHQLPPAARVFVGRDTELRHARGALMADPARPEGPAPFLVIDGPAGVGKTAFALQLAYTCAEFYPEGRLHVDLRGTHPAGPRSPGDALACLLTGLGIAADRLPRDVEGRSALYRGLMHGRRTLLLLDDARDAEQLRPLLPPGPSAVLVTSRWLQRGLLAREGAQRIGLSPLDRRAAVGLFTGLLGPERCAGQSTEIALLADFCGRLPLAIRIAAGTLVANPYLSPRDLARRYADPRTRLDHLSVDGDAATSVRAALDASHRTLPPDAARLLCALGRSGTTTTGPSAAAVHTGGDTAAACRQLDVLADTGLLERTGPDAYRLAELVRIYAAERADEADRAAMTLLSLPLRGEIGPGRGRPEALAAR